LPFPKFSILIELSIARTQIHAFILFSTAGIMTIDAETIGDRGLSLWSAIGQSSTHLPKGP
jgi:hypothetical protein